MNEPLIVVLGDKGFLGKNLVNHFVSKGFEVLGVRRDGMCLFRGQSSVMLASEEKEFKRIVSGFPGKHILINCIRDNNLKFSEDDLLRMHQYSQRATKIINFSTYIQHYESSFNSTLKLYRENQLLKSRFFSENVAEENLLDISLYTLYGHGDLSSSFLTSITRNMLESKRLLLTNLEQMISYTWVGDVCELLTSLTLEKSSRFGHFSFWQTPPLRLEDYFNDLLKITGSTSELVRGAIPYKGHEIFDYEENCFPEQISPNFPFTSFEDGVKFLISYH